MNTSLLRFLRVSLTDMLTSIIKRAAPFDHGWFYVANARMHESDRLHKNISIYIINLNVS
ncbi:MAG: hypothetical protein ACI85N_000833 [Gammaproteobacteria bacterium]|jgi:hypothetical protein